MIVAPVLLSVSPCCSAYIESRPSVKFVLYQVSENLDSYFFNKEKDIGNHLCIYGHGFFISDFLVFFLFYFILFLILFYFY